MYNGIGLTTARGSGTNGFVQRNRSALKPKSLVKSVDPNSAPSVFRKQPNKDILEHEKKRQIEIKCLELEDQLRLYNDTEEEEIIDRVDALRKKLLDELEKSSKDTFDVRKLKAHEVHQLAEAKEKANSNFASALGIRQEDYVEGAAFDPEVQERRKMERRLAREKREAEWEAERIRSAAEKEERRKKWEEDRKKRQEAEEAKKALMAKERLERQERKDKEHAAWNEKESQAEPATQDGEKEEGEVSTQMEVDKKKTDDRPSGRARRRFSSKSRSPSPPRGRRSQRHSSVSRSRSRSVSSASSDDRRRGRSVSRGRKRRYSSSRSRSFSSRSSRRSYSRSRSSSSYSSSSRSSRSRSRSSSRSEHRYRRRRY